jgi:hypothetical protein
MPNASPDPRSLRKLITQQRDWVMIAENVLRALSKPKVDFPKSGYGVRSISITPGSRDFETRESSGRRERNQPKRMSCRLAERGLDRESSRVRNLEKHWGKCRTKQTGRRSWTSACICKSWVFLIRNPVIQLSKPNAFQNDRETPCSDASSLLATTYALYPASLSGKSHLLFVSYMQQFECSPFFRFLT